MALPRPALLNSTEPIIGLENLTIGDFWRWAYSDVLSNRNRSIFAEYVVGVALGVVGQARVEWGPVDLYYGQFKIEVKSSAYCAPWYQAKESKIVFGIRKAVVWDWETNKYSSDPTRFADVYVFCLYPERDKTKANVLDIPAWKFYVMPVDDVNRHLESRKSVSLSSVERLALCSNFDELKRTVDEVLQRKASSNGSQNTNED